MSVTKEQKWAKKMMHVCLIIGALSFILLVISIAWQTWLTAIAMAGVMGLQYYNYKQWQKKA